MPSDFRLISRDPVRVRVAGTTLVIPYHPAAVWAKALGEMNRLPLVGSLADAEGRELLSDLLLDHPQAVDDLNRESLRLLEEVSGWKWWEAARLINTSLGSGVLGPLILRGLDPWARSVGEWCAATYSICTKGADETATVRFNFSLSLPPHGYEDEWDDGADDPTATMEAVQAMMGKK